MMTETRKRPRVLVARGQRIGDGVLEFWSMANGGHLDDWSELVPLMEQYTPDHLHRPRHLYLALA